jgi:hypothetical protein
MVGCKEHNGFEDRHVILPPLNPGIFVFIPPSFLKNVLISPELVDPSIKRNI